MSVPSFVSNIRDAYARRSHPDWVSTNYWGSKGPGDSEKAFSFASGIDKKMFIKDGQISWRGFSGILQFIHKAPFGYLGGPGTTWGLTLNQIFWNIVIFVLIFGSIYGVMIRDGHISVPEKAIQAQNNDPIGTSSTNDNYMQQGLYFALVTTTTLGFGDIVPKTVGGQVMVMFHILLFFIFNFIWVINYDPLGVTD